MAINAQELQGQWNKLKGQVKEKWGQLTDDDLQISNGNIDQLVGRIQQKTGVTRETVEKFLTDLTGQGSSMLSNATQAVGDFTHQAGDRFRAGYEQVSGQLHERYEDAEEIVKSHPAQSLAAAFGIGVVAGLIVGLALRSR